VRKEQAMDEDSARKLTELTTDLMMVFGRMKRAAQPGAGGPVHPGTEFAILDTIQRHGRKTVPEIAGWRGVARQSVQAVVNKLIEAGTLVYVDNPGHKSSKHLKLTPRGLGLYRTVQADMMGRYARLKSELRPGDVEAAVRVLALIAETWDLPEGEREATGLGQRTA
jgi:DNA-binding MarR family transcriptional regulator